MANLSILRRSRAGNAGSFRHVWLALVALIGTASLLGFVATRTLAQSHTADPAPGFLRASLGPIARPSSSAALPARTFASMRSAVTPDGLRVSAQWADLGVTSLDAGAAKWTGYATGAARTTPFGSETVSLAGVSGEEFLTVTKHRGAHTWRWLLDTPLAAHVNQNGEIGFTDANGKTVLLHVGAPTVLDAQGHALQLAGLRWGLTHERGRQLLTLHVDDRALPTPYTIDPSVSLSSAAYTAVKGSGQSGSFTLTIPAGSANGDLLIVQLAVRSNGAVTAPSGWSLFGSSTNGNGLSQYIYTRTMAAPDVAGATVDTWTIPSGIDAAGGLVALRNVDGAPTNPSQQTALATGTTSPASVTVTTDSIVGSDSDYVLAFYGGQANFTFTETNASLSSIWASATNEIPNGSGQQNGGTVSSGSSGASRAQAAISAGLFTASTAVTPSATLSATGNPWIVHVLAFRPALPYNQAVPTVSGTVAVGQTLTAATGTWSNSPTAFTYQWLRCDSGGANCVSIAGATSSTYVLVGTDSGSTIRVRVGASNALGAGATAQSAQTVLVPATNGSGTLTTPTSSVAAGATGNTVTFTYTAATGGLTAGKVQLTVPAGWTAPSTTGLNAGFTTSSTGAVAVAGQAITVGNVTLAGGATMTITYGSKASGGAGATASTTAGPQTWSAAEASTSGGTVTALTASPSITVTPGPATTLAWSQQPTNTGAGSSISPSPTVAVQDSFGNTVTSSSASITAAIGTNPGSSALSGTTTVSAVSGVATFSNLSLNNVGTGYTLQAASTGLTSATSSAFNIAVGAPAKLSLVQQPTSVSAGSSISPSITVAVQDAAGNTVTTSSASVTVAIGTNPGVGTLSGTTTVSASSGIATFANLSLDKVGTGYTLALSSTGLTSATSSAFNVNAGAAAKLAFVQQPTSVTAGTSLSPAVTVAVTDASDNTVTGSAATITLAVGTNPGGGTLSGTTSSAASSGVASFANLSIDKGGIGYTLAASSAGLTGVTSSSFNVNVAAVDATQSTVSASPASVIADGAMTSTIAVTAKDAFGNLVSGQSVSLTQGAGSSTISPATATTNGGGVATFTVKNTTAGVVTYTATIGATTILQTAAVTFTAGPPSAAQSTLAAAPTTVVANGAASATITARAKDAFGNAITTGGATVAFATDHGSLSSVTDNGDGTYTATIDSTVAGLAHISGTLNGLPLNNSSTVTFVPGAANAGHSTLSASPSNLIADGTAAATITVQAKDANDNSLTSGGSTVALVTDRGTLSSVTDNGDGTYTATLTSTSSSIAHLSGTLGGVGLANTATVTFVPGPVSATQSTVIAASGAVSTDSALGTTVTVTIKDAFGNPIAGSPVSLAADAGSSTISPVLGTTTGVNGAATFSVTDTIAEPVVYSATAAGTLVNQTAGVQYLSGAANAATSTLSASPTSLTVGATATVTVHAHDVHGNSLTTGGALVAVTTDAGSLSGVTDNGDGTYSATLTTTISGAAHVTGTIGGTAVPGSATVTFAAGAPAAADTTITASPTSINADGSSGTATITVQTKDAYGNTIATGGSNVTLAATLGSLSSVTDNNDGTYSAALTPGGISGTAGVTGTVGGAPIAGSASVTLSPPVPVTVVDSGPSAQSATAAATFTFHSPNDNSATFECKLDGGSFATCTSPVAYSGLADGSHTFTVRGVNVNGPGSGAPRSWDVDTTAPTVAFTTAPGAYTNNAVETLTASASDVTSGVNAVDFLYAANPASCPTGTLISTATTAPYTATWTLPADGTYVVCAVARDLAGNNSLPVSSTVVVDQTKPSVNLSAIGTLVGSTRYVRGTPTLDATSSDATSGVSSVDFGYTGAAASGAIATLPGTGTPGASAPYDTTWATGSLPDGTYTVVATSSDKSSNSDTSSQTVVVDNTSPSASLDDPGAYGHGTLALTVTSSDTGAGVDAAATVVQSSPHGAGSWTTIANSAAWAPADGTYDLRAIVSDNAGNQTTTATRSITIDSTPPTVTDDADGGWHAGDVTVNLGAADTESGVAGVQYKVDSGSFTTGTSVVVAAPSDGSNDGIHTITYHATNRAGVTSSDATTTVKIDHTPPSNITLDSPAPSALLRGTLTSGDLAATAQDAASGLASTTFRTAPAGTLAANPCDTFGTQISPPFDTTSVPDGHYDFWVVAVDNAGNGSCSVVPHDVVIDNTAPVTTDNAPAGAQNHDVSVNLGATDNLTGIAETDYSLDGGTTWLLGTTVVIPAPSDGSNDGSHTIEYRSRDNAGNVEAVKSAQVTIDTTAPAGNAADPGSVLSGTVQLTASPTATDVASVQFLERPAGSLGAFTPIGTNGTGSPWQVPWLTNGVTDGSYDIEVVVTDEAGNSSSQLLSSKIVDNTAPDSAAVTAPAAAADAGGSVAFAAVAHDATSGVGAVVFQVQWTGAGGFATVDADTSAPYTGSWNSTGVPDGPAQVRVAVTDVAGNGPIYSSPVSFTVDNTAPTVVLSAPAATNGVASLSASGAADIQSVTYAYSPHGAGTWTTIGTVSSPFATNWATGSVPEGAYDVRVTATDGGGNSGTDTATVLVDRTSPAATLTQPANGTTVGGTSVALAATASDSSAGVASVAFEYRLNGSTGAYTAIATSTSSPYAVSWDASALAAGDYQVRVVVTDQAGNTFTTSHVVTIDAAPPLVTSPNVAAGADGTETPADVQVPSVARSPFAFTIATAPRSTVAKHTLIGRALATTTARIDVTLDAYPYHRLQRWHFFHVKPGATTLRLPLNERLRPGLYRLFWKATSDADHTVARRITPLRILGHAAAHDSAGAIVVISESRSVQSFQRSVLATRLYQASLDQAFLYATYNAVAAFVLDVDTYGVGYVRTFRTVFPRAIVVAVSGNASTRRGAADAGAVAVRAPVTAAAIAAALESGR